MPAPAPPGIPHLTYRPDIDGLRAVAVLSVVLYHAYPGTVRGGFVGVDIFFVISGFLISGIIFKSLTADRFSYADFYARRIRRIFPALAVMLTILLAAGWFWLLPDDYARLGRHTAAGATFISNLVLWRESGYFDAPELKPLLHLWSLGIEEQYYIFWPLLLAFLWKRTRRLIPAMLGIALASFALNVWLVRTDQTAAFYLPFTRFWELLIGGLVAYLDIFRGGLIDAALGKSAASLSSRARAAIGTILGALGAVSITTGLAMLNRDSRFPGWWALLPVAGAALLIASGPGPWIHRHVLANRWVVFVGLISYPLYLWHWPLISLISVLGIELPDQRMRLLKSG